MKSLSLIFPIIFLILVMSCKDPVADLTPGEITTTPVCDIQYIYNYEEGCDGQIYQNPSNSPYIIPFPIGTSFNMGLTNCSSSFHGSGQPDAYAFDFDLPEFTSFISIRAGEVVKVVENQPSGGGGGAGNYLVIDHGDQTFGLYYHSPENGIEVEVGSIVEQGQTLGQVGKSGLAGYSHLHLIVVKDQYDYPYEGLPISFNNVNPPVVVLQTGEEYQVCE